MHPGYDAVETRIDFSGKKPPALPLIRLTRSTGSAEMTSQPSNASVTLRSEDGQTLRNGLTPQTLAGLPTGKYNVTVRHGDWQMNEDIEIVRGEVTRKSFAFVNAN